MLNSIKKRTGCSYLSFERYKDTYNVRAIKNGKEMVFKLTGKPSDVTNENLLELENMINYEQ